MRGIANRDRKTYKLWEEGKGPDVVIEATSDSTRNEDLRKKFRIYEQTLRVTEYFLFDPTEDYLKPQLQGYRLRQGKYAAMVSAEGRLHSELLGFDLVVRDGELRLFDPAGGQWLKTPAELVEEVARLHVELEQLRQKSATPKR